jgi:hypothetical protein
MLAAFLVGLVTAFIFRPLALVPVGAVFLLASLFLGERSFQESLVFYVLAVILMNAGYLLGALVHRWFGRNGRTLFA